MMSDDLVLFVLVIQCSTIVRYSS